MTTAKGISESGLQKSAVLMMAIGEDAAAEVFRHLSQREVQELGSAMATLSSVTREEMAEVLGEFRTETEQYLALNVDSNAFIRSVLNKALGEERAQSVIEDILESRDPGGGIDSLNWMDATAIAELIRDEHPQIIATILIHLDRQKSSEVLALFTDRLRNDVILRIATFGGVQPGALQELTDVLTKLLAGQSLKRSRMGGVRTAAEIINLMSTAHEEAVIDGVRLHDGDLAQKIIDEMFLFENLLEVDDRGIQRVLKEIATESLIVALKGAPQELRDKFIRNMSTRAGEMLREDLDALGPVRVSQVEAEQKAILQVVRRLADAGEVQIGGGDDAYV
ncbi:flagellar motor switch protein FliG [Cupriavidus necator]|uniref:Flagellar motor switch protein FliG n=1 Tax=Cupriavidus necator (strain ATCC 17699 / DSM 428 / KCTC 22496 / NCIMB 10442 / H16 / Stanier 337) TaxID=381666 RepID=Q0JYM3_CUPNH|nr:MULTISPECIES: flagellar motor switch protein FliG [Cupriavidus]EON19998.1 flagellar motor switch protein G [Cupriavidus sp. GA3-3]KUE88420.1 flagellar motor switch protein G [Cupriavidus necator]QCC04922.1 flagellar motor switch protein FliG [Cupriavidus necator H16]QQB79609.1 flagellar motor switch protein FliG [Cupriavidus necator]WKA43852.1 flagellar motor switch protein FliG [Cupriavidus necator]